MTKEQKYDLLLKIVKHSIESKNVVSESFANSHDYVWAEHFKIESSVLTTIEMLMEDEQLMMNMATIYKIKLGGDK